MHYPRSSLTLLRARALPLALLATAAANCTCDDELALLPGDITGFVCSADTGSGLENVRVVVVDAAGNSHEVLTGNDGSYSLERIKAGDAKVTIESPDGERSQEVVVPADDTVELSDDNCRVPSVPPEPVGAVSGCICDIQSGGWVSGANAYILTSDGGIFSATTDDDGCFTMPNLPPGAYTVTVERGQFSTSQDVTVVDGETATLLGPDECVVPPPPENSGTVVGRVCAGDGTTWLADADVYVEREDGSRAAATTDNDGHYTLVGVPAGTVTVHVEKGSFSSSFQVTVTEDETTTVPEAQCQLLPPNIQIAVVQGSYDKVEDVLSSLGVEGANVHLYDGAFFGGWVSELVENYETLSSYDVVFFNCGLDDSGWAGFSKNQVAIDNLRQYVANGGSVYASDWAYDIVEQTWPDFVDFEGTDTVGDTAQKGVDAAAVVGSITDPGLAIAMGQNTVSMDYLLAQWAVMSAVSNGVTVYVRGDAEVCSNLFCTSQQTRTNIPHTIGFSAGAGRVLYTSFHQEPGVNADQERILQLLMFEL